MLCHSDWDAGREIGKKGTAYFNTTHCSCLKITCKKYQSG
jgi:hypothetical protein